MRVIVAQKGAREHFLAARALHRRGLLEQLVVDWYAPTNPGLRWLLSHGFGRRFQGALAARAPEIPDRLVRANRLNGLLGKWTQSIGTSRKSPHERALAADVAFIKMISRLNLPPHEVFFGYSYMSLEVLAAEKNREVLTLLDQIDPGPFEFRLVAQEMAQNPALAGLPPAFPAEYFDRLRREWELADVIVVNSEWTQEAIVAEGADPGKIELLPLAYEGDHGSTGVEPQPANDTPVSSARPLKVLWLGQVNLRKGIHFLIQAARLLDQEPVQIDIVGPVDLSAETVASVPRNLRFHGPVSRDRAAGWYRLADVFVLPTLSDGFALTQLEALAHGLPVVATPNCGRVVADGKTGFVVPARDAQALAEAILRFVRTPGLAREMRGPCREAVKAYSVDAYGRRLVEIMERRLAAKGR
jgi:glycosyltransferase involved in cell wall biosynthesis